MAVIDCRGMPCPQPVVECRRYLETAREGTIEILVDNEAAVQNLTAFLSKRGWKVEVTQEAASVRRLRAEADTNAFMPLCGRLRDDLEHKQGREKILVFLSSETIGMGDDELGSRLMQNFLTTLPEMGADLWRLVLVNGGVRLATMQASAEAIRALEKNGVSVLVCGTCLSHFDLMDKKLVGETTNMLDIVTSMQIADKVIRP